MANTCRAEGLMPSPESAATVAAARRLVEEGWIRAGERVVLFQCGTMLKHPDLLDDTPPPVLAKGGPLIL
jgi:threonine synthase